MSRIKRLLLSLLMASAVYAVDGPPITGIGGTPIFENRPEMLNYSPAGIVGGQIAGVHDGKLWAKAYASALACSDGRNLEVYSVNATPVVLGWYANQSNVFVVRLTGGHLFIDTKPATLGGAWTAVDLGTSSATGTYQVTTTQLPSSMCSAGAGRTFYAEYSTAQATTPAATPALVYSGDSGTSWDKLVEADGGAVRHFHGCDYYCTGWLRVWCTKAAITNAFVKITGGATPDVKLYTFTDPNYTLVATITWAPNQTVNDLVTAINAADGTNWHAELVVDRNGDHFGYANWNTLAYGGPTAADATYGHPCYDTAGQTGRNAQVLYSDTVPEAKRIERLYLWSGDAAPVAECTDQSSSVLLLKCDDIPALIADGATWKTNWTLDVVGTDRDDIDWEGKTNVLCHSTQNARIVTPAINNDGLYYIPDMTAGADVCFVSHWDGPMTPKVLMTLDGPTGWGACTVNGVPVVTSTSDYGTGSYNEYNDAYVRLYAVAPTSQTPKLAARLIRFDAASPFNNRYVRVNNMSGYKGHLWYTTNYGVYSGMGLVSHVAWVSAQGLDQRTFDRSLNPLGSWVSNPAWADTPVGTGGAWAGSNCTPAEDAVLYPSWASSSIKLPAMTAANTGTYGMTTITGDTFPHTTGWVSFWSYVYCGAGMTDGQKPAVRMQWGSSGSGLTTVTQLSEPWQHTQTWQLYGAVVLAQRHDPNSLYAYIYGHYSGTLATADYKQVNFASPQLCRGQLPMLGWQRRAGGGLYINPPLR